MAPFLALITPIGGDGPVTPPVQPPLGIWGPTDPRPTFPISGWNPGTGQFPPYQPPVQQPPYPSHPIYGNFPTPPIFYPPGTRPPGQGGPMPPQPQPPLVIWGPGDPRPTLPIAGWNPGTGQWPEGEETPKFEMKTGWSAETGWVVVFVPTGPTATPSEDDGEEEPEAPAQK